MTAKDILDEMKAEVTRPTQGRMYAGGLLPAFCEFFLSLDTPSSGFKSFQDFLKTHPQIETNKAGRKVNQLSVAPNGNLDVRPVAIRGPYNAVERFYINENARYDYKIQPAHATGQWGDYRRWFDTMVTFSRQELENLRDDAKAFMLSHLREHKFDPTSVKIEPPIFATLLEKFPWSSRAHGEAAGAAFQAMVFAFIRADSPHLQVETRKLHAGSSRTQGVGDIDAWDGARLVISAEVKHFKLKEGDLAGLSPFFHKVRQRGSVGLVVAEAFADDVERQVREAGLNPLSITDLARTVAIWDPLKQRNALNAFEWVVVQKERSSGLIDRFYAFLKEVGYPSAVSAPEVASITA